MSKTEEARCGPGGQGQRGHQPEGGRVVLTPLLANKPAPAQPPLPSKEALEEETGFSKND